MKSTIKFFCLGFFFLFINGCGSHLNINYDAENFRNSPLSTISSKSFFIRIEDKRPENEIGFVGYYYRGFRSPYNSNLPPSEIISSALIEILKENGHQATMDEKSNSTDLMLSVQLNNFLQDFRFSDMEGKSTSILVGHINADITIINRANNQEIFKKSVNTIDSQPFTFNVGKTYEEAYSKHIKQFFDDIFLDFELISALKKI